CGLPARVFPAETKSPHPEEAAPRIPQGKLHGRLEGWATRTYLWPILRDASLRDAPQDEVVVRCPDLNDSVLVGKTLALGQVGRLRRSSISAALTSAGRSCWVQ